MSFGHAVICGLSAFHGIVWRLWPTQDGMPMRVSGLSLIAA